MRSSLYPAASTVLAPSSFTGIALATSHRRGRIVDLTHLDAGDIVAITLEIDGGTPTVAKVEVLSAEN